MPGLYSAGGQTWDFMHVRLVFYQLSYIFSPRSFCFGLEFLGMPRLSSAGIIGMNHHAEFPILSIFKRAM